MSPDTTAGTAPAPAAGRRSSGRHRLDRPSGVRCSELPAVRARLDARPHRASLWLRALRPASRTGRHTWDALTSAGGRPRTAFAIILSL